MPEEDDASFGSDSFGFEREPIPSPQTPGLPPPGQPENGFGSPAEEIPSRPGESGAATPPPSGTPSLFEEDAPATKPSLFDEPATPPQQPEASETPDAEEKPEDSIDNLFDDFGRASQMQSEQLRQRLAAVNQKVARRRAFQPPPGGVALSIPGQLASAEAAPLVSRETHDEKPSTVMPASVEQRTGVRSNPLR